MITWHKLFIGYIVLIRNYRASAKVQFAQLNIQSNCALPVISTTCHWEADTIASLSSNTRVAMTISQIGQTCAHMTYVRYQNEWFGMNNWMNDMEWTIYRFLYDKCKMVETMKTRPTPSLRIARLWRSARIYGD